MNFSGPSLHAGKHSVAVETNPVACRCPRHRPDHSHLALDGRTIRATTSQAHKEKCNMTFANLVLAEISLSAVIWWLVVGLIAGFLASLVMRGGGYGIVGDIIVGLVGALILFHEVKDMLVNRRPACWGIKRRCNISFSL
jgi:uncharacterized membrane protein YeaQ/YmgE (transglycosylase-associated protein family)